MSLPARNPNLRRIGANVRRERIRAALTQEKLAERANLNIRTVQKIEAGQMDFLVTTAMRIQRAIACSWKDFFSEV